MNVIVTCFYGQKYNFIFNVTFGNCMYEQRNMYMGLNLEERNVNLCFYVRYYQS